MNITLASAPTSVDLLWKQIKDLFAEHHFLTIVCAFFAVMMVLSFYRFLKSISPALVVLICGLILLILLMHWTATRTEPAFLSPVIDWCARFVPSSNYTPAKK